MARSTNTPTTSVLVTCPDYDRMTRYLSAWANKFIDEARKRGHEVNVLKASSVNRDKFESMVQKMRPIVILEPSNKIAAALMKGHTAAEAVEKGRQAYGKSIQIALSSDVQSDDDKYIPYLIWDRTFLTSC